MKRIFALLLAVLLCVGLLVACDNTPDPSTDTGTNTGSAGSTQTATGSTETDTNTDTATGSTATGSQTPATDSQSTNTSTSDTTNNKEPEDVADVYNPNIEHKILVGDLNIPGLVVLDLNKCANQDWSKLTSSDAVIWEWDPKESEGCDLGKQIITGISEAKYRWSEYYKKYVIIALNSAGWCGVIDYETKATLWETELKNSPHSIEMMPNGDIVIVGSGTGAVSGSIVYYPLSQTNGSTEQSSLVKLPGGHGVSWDPQNNVLWAVYDPGLVAFEVENYGTANATLKKLNGMSVDFEDDYNGHDFMPVDGQPGKYWVSAAGEVWQFDANEITLDRDFEHSAVISNSNVKGIAHFADGTIVMTVAGKPNGETKFSYSTLILRILTIDENNEIDVTEVKFSDREFYKVHAFCPDYQ